MSSVSRIALSIDGHLARITLSAPERHNAITAGDAQTLAEYLDAVDADASVRVVVLESEPGPTFCSGAALDELQSGAMTPARFEALANRLAEARVPVVCALGGSVFGGGAELALCCDFRIGVRGMRMAVPAARIGVCYPLGGLRRFVAALDRSTAARVLLAGDELDAEELHGCGFLTHLVEPEELEAATTALAERLSRRAPLAVQAMKRIIAEVTEGSLDERAAAEAIERCAASADLAEGLAARREKREPRFRGE